MSDVARKTQFPVSILKQAVFSPQGSKAFLKRLIPAALVSIIYQRLNYDKNNFAAHTFHGQKYVVLQEKAKDTMLDVLKYVFQDVLEVLEKDYLRQAYLFFYNLEDENEVIESYRFDIKCTRPDVLCVTEQSLLKDIKESTVDLLKSINCLSVLPILAKDKVGVKMCMTYHEEILPPGYRPQTFDQFKGNLLHTLERHSLFHTDLGTLKTGHHMVKWRGRGETIGTAESSQRLTDEEDFDISKLANVGDTQNLSTTDVKDMSLEGSQKRIRCTCGIAAEIVGIDMVVCSKCVTWQHSPCTKMLNAGHVYPNYVCVKCNKDKDLTADEMTKLERRNILRLNAAYIHLLEMFPHDIMQQLPKNIQNMAINDLKTMRILSKDGNGWKFDFNFLRKMLKGLFPHSKPYLCSEVIDLTNSQGGSDEPAFKKMRRN